jgi:hypothetical protein
MMLPKDRPTDTQGWANRAPDHEHEHEHEIAEKSPRTDMPLAWSALAGFVALLANPFIRHWVGGMLMNVCVVGGILAAPVVSVVGWVGLVLPARALLHQYAPSLVAFALIWFALAIVSAHTFRLDRRRVLR